MPSKTSKAFILAGSVIGIAAVAVGATLGVQALLKPPAAPPPVTATQTPPTAPPPPAPPIAQVLTVKPHYVTTASSTQKCHPVATTTYVQEPTYHHNNGDVAGTVVGGALGGLAGSAIHGSARTAAIIAGAGLGAYAGHQAQANHQQQPHYVTVPQTSYTTKCSTESINKQLQQGYEVTYWYNGSQGTLIMDTPPTGGTILLPGYSPPPTNPTPTAVGTADGVNAATGTIATPITATGTATPSQ